MKRAGVWTRGAHNYFGNRNSRGKRSMSKIHKGLDSGNVERAFREVEKLRSVGMATIS